MSDDLSILPPDKDLFHDKKPVSQKQKLHLEKARLAAKATIERRRALDIEAKKKLALEDEVDVGSDAEEEEKEVPKQPKSILKQKPPKTAVLTEEEDDTRRFNKFMKNMNKYEKFKEQKLKELEEAKKIHMSFTPDQHQHIFKLLAAEKNTKKQLAAVDPVKAKPDDVIDPRVRRVLGGSGQLGRFGR